MDTVLVRVAGHEFIEFSEFTIEADLYSMADSFSFTGANPAFG